MGQSDGVSSLSSGGSKNKSWAKGRWAVYLSGCMGAPTAEHCGAQGIQVSLSHTLTGDADWRK